MFCQLGSWSLHHEGFCVLPVRKLVTSPRGILLSLVESGSLRLSGKQAVKTAGVVSCEEGLR